jgi:hypothetical protein
VLSTRYILRVLRFVLKIVVLKKRPISACSISFLKCSLAYVSSDLMDDKLMPTDPRDVETALALALTSGKALARTQSAETMSKVVAERLVAQLKASGFAVMRRPIEGGHSQRNAPASWPHTKPEDLR